MIVYKKSYDALRRREDNYIIEFDTTTGRLSSIPKDESNYHYREYLKFVQNGGNTLEHSDKLPPKDSL